MCKLELDFPICTYTKLIVIQMQAKCSVVQPGISNAKQTEQLVCCFFQMLQMHKGK